MKAPILLALPFLILLTPLAASAQRQASNDCNAVRQARVFAQSQGMDSVELERLERRACRRRQRRANNTGGGCQALRMMEEIASIARSRSVSSEVAGAKRAVCSADYGQGSLRWGNGRQLRSSSGTYYWPDGRYARSSSGTWYYPDGRYARSSSGTWYFPDGRYAKSTNGRWYTVGGNYLSSRGDAMLYVCQRSPGACDGRRGGEEIADARLVGMLWRAG